MKYKIDYCKWLAFIGALPVPLWQGLYTNWDFTWF